MVLRLQGVPQAADGGDAHGSGKNGGMAVAGAALGHEAQNLGLVQLQRLGGGQIVRRQDHRLLGIDTALHNAHEVIEKPLGHILNVGGSCLHVGVVHGGKHGCKLLACHHDGVLRVALLFLHGAQNGIHIILVLDEHGVGLKQDCGFIAGFLPAVLRQNLQLGDGFLLRLSQPGLLRFHIRGNLLDLLLGTLIEINVSLEDALGNTLALNYNHSDPPVRS